MDAPFLVHVIVDLVVIAMIAGILWYLVGRAPFIPEPAKSFIQWVIIALCGLAVIYMILLPMVGGGSTAPILRR